MDERNEKKTEVDAWTRQIYTKAREYMAQGMSAEKAEERATDDIRREIRQS